MMRLFLTAVAASAMLAGAAFAQTTSGSGTTGTTMSGSSGSTAPAQPGNQGRANTTTGSSNEAVNPSNTTGPDAARTGSVTSPNLEAGSNSFTEAQARGRFEAAGFQNIQELKKDDQGIWRGRAQQNGQSVSVGLDYKGNVARQ